MVKRQLGRFSVYYDTEETEDHSMDARDLILGIEGLADAITQADKLLNGEESSIEIKVNAPSPGSLGLPVEVLHYLSDSKNVLEIIGFIGAASGSTGCVFGILDFLKGRKISAVADFSDGRKKITTTFKGKEEEIVVHDDYAKLVVDREFRSSIHKALVSPVVSATNAKVHIKSFDGNSTKRTIDNENFNSLRKLQSKTCTEESEETKIINIRFIDINFDKTTGWEIEHLQEPLTVSIDDAAFIRRIRSNQDNFARGDLFEVQLKTIETIYPNDVKKYKYIITKVIKKLGGTK